MILTSSIVDDIRELIEADDLTPIIELELEGATLGAALELACFLTERHRLWSKSHQLQATIANWQRRSPLLGPSILSLLRTGMDAVPSNLHYAAPEYEVAAVPLASQLDSIDWGMYLDRFRRSLMANGFHKSLAYAIAKALAEMTDNVISHSSSNPGTMARGAVGFHVLRNRMTFAVVDIGQGVLSSLTRNPRWHHLHSHHSALEAAVWQRATSRVDEDFGDGFTQVHRALTDLNGQLRFRSGDCAIEANGRGDQRQVNSRVSLPLVSGFQITVSCTIAVSEEAPTFS
jgi:hypothetical protein